MSIVIDVYSHVTSRSAGAITSHFPAHSEIGVLAVTNLHPQLQLTSSTFGQMLLSMHA